MPIKEEGAGIWPRLARLGNEHGITSAAQLGREINASTQNLQRWKGGAIPELATLERIARFFEVPIDELCPPELGRADAEMTAYPSLLEYLASPMGANLEPDLRRELLDHRERDGDPGPEFWPLHVASRRARRRGKAEPDRAANVAAEAAAKAGVTAPGLKPTKTQGTKRGGR